MYIGEYATELDWNVAVVDRSTTPAAYHFVLMAPHQCNTGHFLKVATSHIQGYYILYWIKVNPPMCQRLLNILVSKDKGVPCFQVFTYRNLLASQTTFKCVYLHVEFIASDSLLSTAAVHIFIGFAHPLSNIPIFSCVAGLRCSLHHHIAQLQ